MRGAWAPRMRHHALAGTTCRRRLRFASTSSTMTVASKHGAKNNSKIRHGRVRRTARSTYVTDHIPPSTVRFIRGWLTDQDIVWEHYGAA